MLYWIEKMHCFWLSESRLCIWWTINFNTHEVMERLRIGLGFQKGSPCIITCIRKTGGNTKNQIFEILSHAPNTHLFSQLRTHIHSIHPNKTEKPSSNPKLFCTSKGNWPSWPPNTQGVDLLVTFVAPQATGIGLAKLRPSAKSNCKWKYFGAEVMPLPTHGRLVAQMAGLFWVSKLPSSTCKESRPKKNIGRNLLSNHI